jgi:CubicO group peptidase (beta-lactamase class C family)
MNDGRIFQPAQPAASAERDPRLDELARELVVESGAAPGASVALGVKSGSGFLYRTGAAGTLSRSGERAGTAALPGTPYDLASVTKPVVACAAARLVRAGALAWNTPVEALLPEVRGSATARASLEHLLSHRAGLDAHCPLYETRSDDARIDGASADVGLALTLAARARRPECPGEIPPGGFAPLYSDLGYVLAGAALSRVSGLPLDALVLREVTGPLGVDLGSADQLAQRRADFDDAVAPTEVLASRGGEIRGKVHDPNAWALTGAGLSGHAGLFGIALDVCVFGTHVVAALEDERAAFLDRAEAANLVRSRPGGTLRAGFDGKAEAGSSCGSQFGPRSFGHLGFTGTSLWCDPDAGLVAVVLTNRVNPTRENVVIRSVRPALHDELHALGRRLA